MRPKLMHTPRFAATPNLTTARRTSPPPAAPKNRNAAGNPAAFRKRCRRRVRSTGEGESQLFFFFFWNSVWPFFCASDIALRSFSASALSFALSAVSSLSIRPMNSFILA